MPIINRNDAADVEECFERIFQAPPEQRAHELRRLFAEVLDFNTAIGDVPLDGASPVANPALPANAERIAQLDGVQALYVPLQHAPIDGRRDTDRVRKQDVVAAARRIADRLGDDMLLVFANRSASQLHLIYPNFAGAQPTLRRMVVERGIPQRTAVQQVANIYWNYRDTGSIRQALDNAFDVDPVTKQFFTEYHRIFNAVERSIRGFGAGDAELDAKRTFTQTLFNRLMFIYFMSRKGWLAINRDRDYLNALWRDYAAADGEQKNFYIDRLRPLFFAGLNNPKSQDHTHHDSARELIGDVPFLNGGLFEQTALDRRAEHGGDDAVTVPDDALRRIMTDLFDKFNFTVQESTPYDVEVAVDPEMLGKVFEELVNDRHGSGSYYTPRAVVAFMCREALKGYLAGRDAALAPHAIAKFIDERDASGIPLADARRVGEALAAVAVVDPACGSGAYLLGMMQELVELQTALYNAGVDPKGVYELKLDIIQRNLYGVDNSDFAVNIAMLRMWLSLAIDYEGERPEPLPNLDLKLVCGDSLLGPDPSAAAYGDLFRALADSRKLGDAKAAYMRATHGDEKRRLKAQILDIQRELQDALGDAAVPDDIVDWRIAFAEVFADAGGGFDVVIANPPYIQLQKDGGKLGKLYRDAGFATFARTGDIYQLFYEQGVNLLKSDVGYLAYITSNSWLKAEYGKSTRRMFADSHTPLTLIDMGKDVFESAIVDSVIFLARKGKSAATAKAVDMDKLADKTFPPAASHWGELRTSVDRAWSALTAIERSAMDKIETAGTPLKEWDVSINFGVKTGYNKAFIIDNKTKESLVASDPKSAELIKPILRGRDIQQYQAQYAGLWLVDTHNGYGDVPAINIDEYPSVKAYLDGFYPQLEKRNDKGKTPYNLRNCAYHEEFSKEKLVWITLVDRGRFAYDDGGLFCLDSSFMMIGESVKYLCALLNASLINWCLQQIAPTSGMGTLQWKKVYVERLPIPKISRAEQRPFIRLVDEILAAKRADTAADTRELEWRLDELVYALYGLTEAESTAIERSLGLIHATDAAEDAALLKWMQEGRTGEYVSRQAVMKTLRNPDAS